MKLHVLPGDSITESFKKCEIEGEIIVCRECLIDGEVKSHNLDSFWQIRASFIEKTYPNAENSYHNKVVREFEKLIEYADKSSKINLWFEYELFCQINMWFCLSLLQNSTAEIYRVAPIVNSDKNNWKGFGNLKEGDLKICFENRVRFEKSDILLGNDLWKAYQNQDYSTLEKLGNVEPKCFPKLRETCQAEIEKQTRPQKTLQKILANGETEFNKIFLLFQETEGIYGFGDLQIKRLLNEL